MLIRKKQSSRSLSAALATENTGLDRRAFLRRAGIGAGALAAVGALGGVFIEIETEAFALPD